MSLLWHADVWFVHLVPSLPQSRIVGYDLKQPPVFKPTSKPLVCDDLDKLVVSPWINIGWWNGFNLKAVLAVSDHHHGHRRVMILQCFFTERCFKWRYCTYQQRKYRSQDFCLLESCGAFLSAWIVCFVLAVMCWYFKQFFREYVVRLRYNFLSYISRSSSQLLFSG